ncbi:DUF1427 family protein [Streptomyces sp. NPDC006516]|uniref:DUF1427 family protein n=1 Tax=Streptomyces sp. NPDC006516 TaxID=3154309 RepID=UPI0033BAA9B2
MSARDAGPAWRGAAVSLAAGLLMGAVYQLMGVTSPAPPLIGLTGLLGIVLGERGVAACRERSARRDSGHPVTPAAPNSTRRPPRPGEHPQESHDGRQ